MDTPVVTSTDLSWASTRLATYLTGADRLPGDPQANARHVAAAVSAGTLPAWPWLVELEAAWGGVEVAYTRLGVAAWLNASAEHGPQCGAGGVIHVDRARRAVVGASTPGAETLVLMGDISLDSGLYVDAEGAVALIISNEELVYSHADSVALFFEKVALDAEIRAVRMQTDTGDFFVEVDGAWGAALADTLEVPRIAEASDSCSHVWWDGTLCVRETATFGDPRTTSTRVEGGDLDRLTEACLHAYRIANKGRKRPRQPHVPPTTPERCLRIHGWPNEHTYGFGRRLQQLPGIGVDVRTTYP